MDEKSNYGRPPLFATPEELKLKIDEYFQTGVRKKKVIDSEGTSFFIDFPTITDLCLFLGFANRQSFYNYEKKPEFTYELNRARTMIEREYELRLHGPAPTGAIFALKNFGWEDRKVVDSNANKDLKIVVVYPPNYIKDQSANRIETIPSGILASNG